MNNFCKKLLGISITTCFFIPGIGFALEVTIIDSGPNVKPLRTTKVERVYPLATAGDVFCGMEHHMVRFRLNANHAGLPFSLTAKRMTRVKV